MDRKEIYAFDFDGTLTNKDSFLEFIRFTRGRASLLWGLFIHSPLLVMMKLGLYSNGKAKERIFSFFFKGISADEMGNFCTRFGTHRKEILRPKGMKTIADKLTNGAQIVILTASVDHWVQAFFPTHPNLHVIGTQIEIADNKLTGKFLTENCYGAEKVKRLQKMFPNRSEYHLIAFGDSRGDKELLEYADEGHYKPFR